MDEKSERPSIGTLFEAVACEPEFISSFFPIVVMAERFLVRLRSSFVNNVKRSFRSPTEAAKSGFGYNLADARFARLCAEA